MKIEEILSSEGVYVSTTVGSSMYPMLRNRKDTIVISPCNGKLKKYDVPLYKKGDKYILHRIVDVRGDTYTALGDNCYAKEYDIREEQIVGILTDFYRGNTRINMQGILYKAYVRVWYWSYPLRKKYKRLKAVMYRVLNSRNGDAKMLEEKHEQTGIYLAELIRAALHGLKAPEKPEGVSWEMLYGFAKRMSVEAISYMGVATLIQKPEKEVLTKWENAAHATLIRNLQYDIEREQILAEMEKAGLSYLTMKGIKLATYYPKPGMRSMCDNDILVGFVEKYEDGYRAVEGSKEQIGEVLEKIMLERGYEITHASVYQDAYKKEPMYNFEMHKSLLYNFSEHYFYYLNPWKKVVPVEGSEYEYKFTLEDEYIYSLVHGHKHYSAGGCGIRLLIDEYIYLSKGSEMNWNYIYQELEVLGLTAYEKEISEAAKNIFSKERGMLKAEEKEMILSMMYNGTYGRISTHRKRDIEKFRNEKGEMTILSKLNYAKNRLILPDEWYENYYTFCKKYPWLKPWVGIYRTITGFLRHPRQLMEELRILLKTK